MLFSEILKHDRGFHGKWLMIFVNQLPTSQLFWNKSKSLYFFQKIYTDDSHSLTQRTYN